MTLVPMTLVIDGTFSASIRLVNPNNPWSDPKGPPPDLNLPGVMGPIHIPQMPQPKPKRRWGWLLAWTLVVFAGGVVAGPVLTEQAFVLVERVAPMLGLRLPQFVEDHRQAARPVLPLPTEARPVVPAPEPGPEATVAEPKPHAGEARGEAPAVVARPAAPPAEKTAEGEHPPAASAPNTVRHAPAAASARAESPPAELPAEPAAVRAHHGRGGARVASSASPTAKRASGSDDPFASEAETGSEPKPAAPSSKSKPAPSAFAASAKSEPAPKPMAARSNDPLDSLMADGVADSKGKKSKDLDALLKDVQKSKPEPPPKREAPPPASALSPADISRVMAGVKGRSNSCAQRLGQMGNAELKITVGKDGHVTDVKVGGKLADTPLGACIDKATRSATFPVSSGLKFDYRIDAR